MTLNVAFTYDQTGHGEGIGRLTSLTDQVGPCPVPTTSAAIDDRQRVRLASAALHDRLHL